MKRAVLAAGLATLVIASSAGAEEATRPISEPAPKPPNCEALSIDAVKDACRLAIADPTLQQINPSSQFEPPQGSFSLSNTFPSDVPTIPVQYSVHPSNFTPNNAVTIIVDRAGNLGGGIAWLITEPADLAGLKVPFRKNIIQAANKQAREIASGPFKP